jgi:PEP-CTERM motif
MLNLRGSIGSPDGKFGLLIGAAFGALVAAGHPADALTIIPSFDASWAAAPVGATIDVNNVITEYEKDFSNPVTITVAFGWGEIGGFAGGPGATPVTSGAVGNVNGFTLYTLAQTKSFYNTAVGLQPTNTALATADAHLPATFTNPAPGGSSLFGIGDSEYLALNSVAQNGNTVDGYLGVATNFCGGGTCPYDFTGGAPGPTAIDFTAVIEHELSHAMGRLDQAFAPPNPPELTPLDFFKYQDNAGTCTTTLDPRFDVTCFSIDGGATNPLGRTFSNVSDSGDWINATGDSYNAFIGQGEFASVSSADITEMCALGWEGCAAAVPTPEPGTLALLSSALLGFTALRRRRA